MGEGERRPQLQKLIAELGLGQRVRLLGGLPDEEVRGLFRSTNIFCLPSLERTEAFGMVLLEAMAAGKPIIASDIPGSGVGWVLQGNEAAVLVPPGDVAALCRALTLADKQFGGNGNARYKELFQMPSVVSQLSKIYSAAVN